jgi:cytochrome c6
MKRCVFSVAVCLLLALSAYGEGQHDGKADFDMYCSGCHPQGGNALNPAKSLRKTEREANGVRSAADIVRIMRKPGKGMRVYTKDDIPDRRAKAIAEYILATF